MAVQPNQRSHQKLVQVPTPPQLCELLFQAYGPRGWWPVADEPQGEPYHDIKGLRGRPPLLVQAQQWEVMVGAILTQNTAWTNVELALAELRKNGILSLDEVACCSLALLGQAIRSSGYFNQKSTRLRELAIYLRDVWGGDLTDFLYSSSEKVRKELLARKGIGPETADSILLYAGNGYHACFVADAYAIRLFRRLGMEREAQTYDSLQAFVHGSNWTEVQGTHLELTQRQMEEHFEANGRSAPPLAKFRLAYLFNEFHALIVEHGKRHCTARSPRCETCSLQMCCTFGNSDQD